MTLTDAKRPGIAAAHPDAPARSRIPGGGAAPARSHAGCASAGAADHGSAGAAACDPIGVEAPRATEPVLLGRQPIVDRHGRMYAFELLFRGVRADPHRFDGVAATSEVLRHVFAELGVERALGRYRGFVNCDAGMLLMPGTLEVLPPERVVVEILESVAPTPQIVARLHVLKAAGYLLALDDFRGQRGQDELLPLVDFIKLDLPRIQPDALGAVVSSLREYPAELLAEKVEDRAQAERCRSMGFDFFQGYFFARPVIIEGRKLGLPQVALLRLLDLLMKDVDTARIVEEFKRQPGLSLNLLRIANSASSALAVPVHSIAQAVVLVGRRHLRRWVQLLLYTGSDAGPVCNPLLQLAAMRGRLMETWSESAWPDDVERPELAFMVGILSLMPAVFGVSFDEILPALPVEAEVRDALVARSGPLGRLLAQVEAHEADPLRPFDGPGGGDASAFSRHLVAAMTWANGIG
jgi:EAL and modified HD-GYP domain-containing signal transduction protein